MQSIEEAIMGYGKADVYYQPEKFDLTPVAELSGDLSWEFDILMVWRHADGTLYTAQDSGCSCPSPFEDYTSLGSLDKIVDFDSFAKDVTANPPSEVGPSEVQDFLRKVRDAL